MSTQRPNQPLLTTPTTTEEDMGKFGIGARVMNGGDEGTITDKVPGRRRVRFDCQQHDGDGNWWRKDELTPVEPVEVVTAPPAFKAGDRVVVTDPDNCVAINTIGNVILADSAGDVLVKLAGWKNGHDGDKGDGSVDCWWFWGGEGIEPAPLTIEPGKFYRTRDGRKAGPGAEWCGVIAAPVDGESNNRVFNTDGSHRFNETNLDLVAEWVEPKPEPVPKFKVGDRVRCVAKFNSGSGFTNGKFYTVDRYVSTSHMGIALDDKGSTTNGWLQSNFEPAPFAVGDAVSVKGIINYIDGDDVEVDVCITNNSGTFYTKLAELSAA